MEKILRWELVELTVPAGVGAGGRVTFNTIPQLRNQANQDIIIQGIEIYLVTSYAASQVNNAIPGMPAAELPKTVLTLYVNGEESIKQIPLVKLLHVQDGTPNPFTQWIQDFNNLTNVDWDKSYVQFNAAAAGNPYIIPFGISYLRSLKTP